MNRAYLDAVRLLLAVAPSIFQRPGFALKGGTAINLFLRKMPRLSVDLDLVFADHRPGRDDAMQMISGRLDWIRDDLNQLGMTCNVATSQSGDELKLFIECFVCYLAGHNRPIHEVLFANEIDISSSHANEFIGMTKTSVTLEILLETRKRLFAEIPTRLSGNHRSFLMSPAEAQPDWSLMSCPHLAEMPALRWKLSNLERLRSSNPTKFAQQSSELKKLFGI